MPVGTWWMYVGPILGVVGSLILWSALVAIASFRLRGVSRAAALWLIVAGLLGIFRTVVLTPLTAFLTTMIFRVQGAEEAVASVGMLNAASVLTSFVPWVLVLVGLWQFGSVTVAQPE